MSTKISEATPSSGKTNNQMQVLAKNNDHLTEENKSLQNKLIRK